MNADLTHASFFSGVGGTDLGLERAGWRTVSFSEIDPYACAVLAERWPGVVNVGDIVRLADRSRGLLHGADDPDAASMAPAVLHATLWSGGFPCQDLSVAGKRAGFGLSGDRRSRQPHIQGGTAASGREPDERPDTHGGDESGTATEYATRSSLAFAFLALVERYRPPAILLENVPGLLSSHGGRDMAALIGRMVELGYGVAYRVLDAQYFGVPQRRRRVFILGLRGDPDDVDGRIAAERAAAVLSVGARCGRHPATGHETGAGVTGGATASSISASAGHHGHSSPRGDGSDNVVIGTVPAALGHHGYTLGQEALSDGFLQLSSPPDADRMRAPDGLAGRAHDSELLAPMTAATVLASPEGTRTTDLNQTWVPGGTADDPLLPLGLDSHRYRCCGNGVVAPVAEWLGLRLAEALA